MIRALKALVDWLDRRYPPRVVLTVERMEDLEERVHRLSKHLETLEADHAAAKNESRDGIDALNKAITAVKDTLQKIGNPSVVAEKRRAEFVASGRMSE
jgi:uncharacterized small protein (DUF1192 family)